MNLPLKLDQPINFRKLSMSTVEICGQLQYKPGPCCGHVLITGSLPSGSSEGDSERPLVESKLKDNPKALQDCFYFSSEDWTPGGMLTFASDQDTFVQTLTPRFPDKYIGSTLRFRYIHTMDIQSQCLGQKIHIHESF